MPPPQAGRTVDHVKRLVPLLILCALTAATPASAQTHKLTVYRAKQEIRRAYIQATGAHPQLVTAGRCERLTRRAVNCRVVEQFAPRVRCYTSERWEASDNGTFSAPDPASASWGACPIITTLTPITGQPTIQEPATDGPTG